MASNTPRPTKAERRQAARERAKQLRLEQERKERQAKMTRRSLLGLGGVIVVGGGGALVWSQQKKGTPGQGQERITDGTLASPATETAGLPATVLSDGSISFGAGLAPGSQNDGAPVLDLFFDYSCIHCAEFEVLHAEEIKSLLEDGKITLALHPCMILQQQWTDVVQQCAGLVLDQAPQSFLDFHTAAFELFTQAAQQGNGSALTLQALKDAATAAGVPGEVVAGFDTAPADQSYQEWVTLGTEVFNDLGLTGTPTVAFEGYRVDLASLGSATALTELVGSDGESSSDSSTPS